ncbi:RNA methyltransferase [Ancylobacter sp. 6x-1]|uniref:RNA methyltransferase n=1 Tax=Ancylobacter crimeensis TaxID=2579147 RepID=A0ABT0D7R4_9HYPH|nr:RNA methyltransferase [Ancylobacter crimeensis]MCK0195987.1 RNA methyltransferase [Ancylobacter crimeensis]
MSERAVLTIDHVGQRGDGVAFADDGPVYVPLALPGERIAIERDGDRGRLVEIIDASGDRRAPFCPHVGPCGGCSLQQWDPVPYAVWKRGLVADVLARAGIEAPVYPLRDAHGAGRRRATFHARSGGNGRAGRDTLAVGFAGRRSHAVVPIDACPILTPGLDGALSAAWAVAEVLAPLAKPLDIQVTETLAGIDMDVRGSGALKPAVMARLGEVAGRHGLARLTRHGELVIQREPPTLAMGRALVPLPPGSFLQATAEGERILAELVVAALTEGGRRKFGRVADLFCGVGTFALRLAEIVRVSAVEGGAAAVEALTRAARSTHGLKPVVAETRDLFRRPLVPFELKAFDAVIFDPPRQGAEAQARELARSAVPLVIAVSCDPVSFTRDARLLIEGGYRLTGVAPVDQFRYSAHVELVGRFER